MPIASRDRLLRLLQPAVACVHRLVAEAGAIRSGGRAARRFAHFGPDSYIAFPQTSIYGERAIHIGSDVLVGERCSLIVGYDEDDALLPERGLVLGDRVVVGAGSTLTAHSSIVIGDDVWFGREVFISDAGHGYQDPETPIGRQLGEHRPVEIGEGSWIGHRAIILPGARLGRHVVVAAGAVVGGDVEDHAIVAGVPARVVRRYVEGTGWVSTRDASDVRPSWTSAEVTAMLEGRGTLPGGSS